MFLFNPLSGCKRIKGTYVLCLKCMPVERVSWVDVIFTWRSCNVLFLTWLAFNVNHTPVGQIQTIKSRKAVPIMLNPCRNTNVLLHLHSHGSLQQINVFCNSPMKNPFWEGAASSKVFSRAAYQHLTSIRVACRTLDAPSAFGGFFTIPHGEHLRTPLGWNQKPVRILACFIDRWKQFVRKQ